jgi:putative membrane protein
MKSSHNISLEKKLNKLAIVLSVVVIVLVAMMDKIKLHFDVDFSFLPGFYSIINALVGFLLLAAFYFIKNKNVEWHRRTIYVALSLSTIFLLSYVLYHITTPSVHYCGEGNIRVLYFVLLVSHIAGAAVSFPFILFTFVKGYVSNIESHKKMARWVIWLWFYVAVTGPIVYLMLFNCK